MRRIACARRRRVSRCAREYPVARSVTDLLECRACETVFDGEARSPLCVPAHWPGSHPDKSHATPKELPVRHCIGEFHESHTAPRRGDPRDYQTIRCAYRLIAARHARCSEMLGLFGFKNAPPTRLMRALVQSEASGRLQVQQLLIPSPPDGHVLVRVECTPVNRGDLALLRGKHGIKREYPMVPGFEGAPARGSGRVPSSVPVNSGRTPLVQDLASSSRAAAGCWRGCWTASASRFTRSRRPSKAAGRSTSWFPLRTACPSMATSASRCATRRPPRAARRLPAGPRHGSPADLMLGFAGCCRRARGPHDRDGDAGPGARVQPHRGRRQRRRLDRGEALPGALPRRGHRRRVHRAPARRRRRRRRHGAWGGGFWVPVDTRLTVAQWQGAADVVDMSLPDYPARCDAPTGMPLLAPTDRVAVTRAHVTAWPPPPRVPRPPSRSTPSRGR